MEKKKAAEQITNYIEGTATPKEKATVETWYENRAEQMASREPASDPQILQEEVLRSIYKEIRPNRIGIWKQISIAASILLVGAAMVFYFNSNLLNKTSDLPRQFANDISPGGNRATLTLDDGSTITLSDAQNGIIIDNERITYTDGTNISPHVISTEAEKSVHIQTLTTPNGGEYQVTLPDGTKVWLNSASVLKYPSRFSEKDRRVELEGEAYFEVAKQLSANSTQQSVASKNGLKANSSQLKPFVVTTKNQEVTVLGTHFNINSYPEEGITKTTLLEGSVRVSILSSSLTSRALVKDPYATALTTILTPGQQSIIQDNKLTTQTANIEEAIAWKNGYFRFNDEKIESIMQKLSRWYDIEVVYEGERSKEGFTGTVSKHKNISQVLRMLEKAKGVHFKIEGRRVVVMQ